MIDSVVRPVMMSCCDLPRVVVVRFSIEGVLVNHRTLGMSLVCVSLAATGCSSGNSTLTRPPAQYSPQTWMMTAGESSHNQALQALVFYPSAITIDAGDSIVWTAPAAEPHTISFPILGQKPLPPTDPTASKPEGGSTYDGTAYASSGFIAGGATYKLTFPKPGTYTFYSLPQEPLAVGTVVVQALGAPYPQTQAEYNATAQASSATDLQNALNSVGTVPVVANTISAGVSPTTPGGATSSVMRYLVGPTLVDDQNVTIPVGTTLTFVNRSNNVPHTVTFPALGQQPPEGPPFQAATGGNTYDGSALVNSGVVSPGGSFKLTFTKAGTYPYYCLFHDDAEGMVATVTVTP
jgi:plastocyanin